MTVQELIKAATVILLRDRPEGVETLLLRRNSKLGFGGGQWVFPGGRVDPADGHPDEEVAARRAAVREAFEEAGVQVHADALVPFAHWTPPQVNDVRRFSTWFFLAEAPSTTVAVDGGEIVDHVWARPAAALELHAAGEIEMMPPTFQSLFTLAQHHTVAEILDAARVRALPRFETRIVLSDEGVIALWFGDAGYEAKDAAASGPRHRLHMGGLPWRYERD
jgi:8-oxo-dGTP pyrophosphatase MutT (NUDIX family)